MLVLVDILRAFADYPNLMVEVDRIGTAKAANNMNIETGSCPLT
jgi:hypothetical protein